MKAFLTNIPYNPIKDEEKANKLRPDNVIFRLHYKLTFWILLISAFLVSSYDFFDSTDSAIQCYHHKKNSDRVINRYCWIMSTFTLPKYAQDDPDFQSIYPGVGETTGNEETIHHNYYQWVPMVLGFQAIFFYLPHWAWKKLEDQRLERVVKGLNQFIVNSTTRENKVEHLADFLLDRTDHMNYEHEIWARKFFACECLNLINIWAQLFLTDRFLGGLFLNYGIKVLSFPYQDPGQRYDPMALIFPRMTKCLFRKYGSSGTIQQIDVLCVLSMNIINEKIYIFLWFWFIFLATITTFWVSFRVAQRFWPKLRERIMTLEALETKSTFGQCVNDEEIRWVTRNISYGNWMFLYHIEKVIDRSIFAELVTKLCEKILISMKVHSESRSEI